MRPRSAAALLVLGLAGGPLLSGCLVAAAAGAVGTVAVTGVKAGAKVTGAVVGVAADGVGAAGRAVTGSPRR